MSDSNPYASPSAPLARPTETPSGNFIPGGKSVPAGEGYAWVKGGFRAFFGAPIPWLVALFLFVVASAIVSIIPFANFALGVVSPLVSAGFYAGGRTFAKHGSIDISDMFTGFREKTSQLVVVGIMVFVAGIVAAGVAVLVGGGRALFSMMSGGELPPGFEMQIVLGVLIYLALIIPVSMATWFAPALVLFQNLEPVEALKQSFGASLKNIVPFLVYSLVLTGVFFVAAIPLGLGFFIALPAFCATFYPAYASIFLDSTKS